MNLKRAIGGSLLAFVFLLFFSYVILGTQWIFDNYPQNPAEVMFLGSISDSLQNDFSANVDANTILVTSSPGVNAKSAISVESDLRNINKIIFQKVAGMQLPIASLTKLMTAVIALDNYNLSDSIVVSRTADSQAPMKKDLELGDNFPMESLLDIMLVGSSNKAAYALAEGPGGKTGKSAFVNLMNKKAKEIGLENTSFVDPTGLSSQDVSTAGDLVQLAEYVLKNYPKIAEISNKKEIDVPGFGTVENTDQLLSEIPDAICSKTGFTTTAKGCLLLVVNNSKNNGYLINVVLGSDDRFQDMKNLINLSSAMCK